MSLPGGDDKVADVNYQTPSQQTRAGLDQSWDFYDLYHGGSDKVKDYEGPSIAPLIDMERDYLNNDVFGDTSGYARTRGAAGAAGAVGDTRKQISPMNMRSGLGASGIAGLAKAQQSGVGFSTSDAGTKEEINMMNRGMTASLSGLRGMSGTLDTTLGASERSNQAGIGMANKQLQRNMDAFAQDSALTNQLVGLASTYAGGVGAASLTQPYGVTANGGKGVNGGGAWNPLNWKAQPPGKYNQGGPT